MTENGINPELAKVGSKKKNKKLPPLVVVHMRSSFIVWFKNAGKGKYVIMGQSFM